MAPLRWNLIVCSLLSLLISAFLDNLRGPLLPYFSRVLNRPYGEISWILSLGNFAAVVTNLSMIPLVARWGTIRVAMGSWIIALATLALAFQVSSFPALLVLSLFLGAVISAMGAACNLLMILGTDPLHRARGFTGLHVMYGLGSFVAPLWVAATLEHTSSWHHVFWPPLIGLALWIVLLSRSDDGTYQPKLAARPLSIDPGIFLLLFTMATYVMGEVTASAWLSAYLVEFRHLTIPEGTPYLTGIFLSMMVTRFLCSLRLSSESEVTILVISLLGSILFFCLGMSGWTWAFSLAGVFGPFFPILLARSSRRYGEHSERLTLWILTATQVGLCVSQFGMGRLTDKFGIGFSFWLSPLLLVTAGMSLVLYLRDEAMHGSSA